MPTVPEHIAQLIRDGRKIEAIKILREETGVDLKTAKEAVDKLDADPTFDPLPLEYDSDEVSEEVRSLAYAGEFIPAIKLLRERTGLGLKESKEIVETLPVDPSLRTRRQASVLVTVAIAAFLLLLGMALAVFFLQA